ncbi:MAG TPA: hypothetical protein VF108_08945 [Actinomycetota bacterium]
MAADRPGGPTRDRVTILLLVAALIGVPGAILRSTCGAGCAAAEAAPARVPFCTLPGELRARIAAGFRDGRSPDVVAVPRDATVVGSVSPTGARTVDGVWPSTARALDTRVPIVFAGIGVRAGAPVPDGTALRQIAPTVAQALAFERPFPQVRSGRAVAGVARPERPRLVMQVVWKDVGTADLAADRRAWPTLRRLLAHGAGTLDGDAGSLPLDPAAALTTIGTGGTPAEHGIVGTWLRDDRGAVIRAWSGGAPTSVIATLADDLDEAFGQRPEIALVGTDAADRGIVGRAWYARTDRDPAVIAGRPAVRMRAVERLLTQGLGRDRIPDLLAVVGEGPVRRLDDELARIVRLAREASGGSLLIVVTATGSPGTPDGPLTAGELVRALEQGAVTEGRLVEAATSGGIFLDRRTLGREEVPGSTVVDALLATTGPDGTPLFADVFQGFAVSFGRYC